MCVCVMCAFLIIVLKYRRILRNNSQLLNHLILANFNQWLSIIYTDPHMCTYGLAQAASTRKYCASAFNAPSIPPNKIWVNPRRIGLLISGPLCKSFLVPQEPIQFRRRLSLGKYGATSGQGEQSISTPE